jgi:biotin transport system substrate-specific component
MTAETLSRRYPLWLIRVLRISFFIVLLIISAKVRIELPNTPVPITGQTLIVLLSGMILGPVEGMLSVLSYVAAIASGLPIDARGLGQGIFVGPTAAQFATGGYLIGFIPAAFVAGLAWRVKSEPAHLVLTFLCGLAAAAIILIFGTLGLAFYRQLPVENALLLSVYPFMLIEPGKALLAASLSTLKRESWLRWFPPNGTL